MKNRHVTYLPSLALLLCLSLMMAAELPVYGEEHEMIITTPEYHLSRDEEGTVTISAGGYGSTTVPGLPRLPSRIISVTLPEADRIDQVKIIPGPEKEVVPAGPMAMASSIMSGRRGAGGGGNSRDLRQERKQVTPCSASYYPDTPGEYIGASLDRKSVV